MTDLVALEGRLRDYMRTHGLKHTEQRRVIVETFFEAGQHIALDELLLRVQQRRSGVGYATVYRTMKMLTEAGVAQERRFGDGQTRYEPAELGGEHHDHLICDTCGYIFEFEDDEIERRQARVATSHGLRIKRHRLDIWGECENAATCEYRRQVEQQAGD